MRRWLCPIACGMAAAGAAHAHHSIGSVYDSSRQVTVEGSVTEFRFVNPHPLLIIETAGESGTRSWQLEMDNRFELAEVGMTADTFKPGDRVIATGSIGRTEPQNLYLRRLDRPADGFRYQQIGSRPSIELHSPR
jgi:Family of unknown function (DUF6152)